MFTERIRVGFGVVAICVVGQTVLLRIHNIKHKVVWNNCLRELRAQLVDVELSRQLFRRRGGASALPRATAPYDD